MNWTFVAVLLMVAALAILVRDLARGRSPNVVLMPEACPKCGTRQVIMLWDRPAEYRFMCFRCDWEGTEKELHRDR